MNSMLPQLCLLAFLSLAASSKAGVMINPVSDDHWDLSQGSVITSHGPTLSRFPIQGIFSETGIHPHTLFSDQFREDHVHFVEWQTAATIDLRSFSLLAIHDGPPLRDARYRGFKTFRLFGFDQGSNSFQQLFELTNIPLLYRDVVAQPGMFIDETKNPEVLAFRANIPTFTGNRFRAEFVQYSSIARGHAAGARIWEMDGFSESFSPPTVPDPTSLLAILPCGLVLLRRNRSAA